MHNIEAGIFCDAIVVDLNRNVLAYVTSNGKAITEMEVTTEEVKKISDLMTKGDAQTNTPVVLAPQLTVWVSPVIPKALLNGHVGTLVDSYQKRRLKNTIKWGSRRHYKKVLNHLRNYVY